MKLNGRNVKFKRTIWATLAIGAMCPDKDPNKLDAVLNENYVDGNMAAAQFCCILSEGYERVKAFEAEHAGKEYDMKPRTMDEVMNIDDLEVFQRLFIEAVNAWKNDSKPTVESEPVKTKKKQKPKNQTE